MTTPKVLEFVHISEPHPIMLGPQAFIYLEPIVSDEGNYVRIISTDTVSKEEIAGLIDIISQAFKIEGIEAKWQ